MVMALISLNWLPSPFYHPKLPAISTLIFIQIKIALICSNDYTAKKFHCFNLFKGVILIETEANIVNVKTTNFYQRSI